MRFTSILACCLLFVLGCQKKENHDLTTVTFTLPDLSGRSAENLYQRVASAPATIDEVNCFAVMVSGPDAQLSRTSCPVVDAANANVAVPKKIGLTVGLVPSGRSITLRIPAGSKRQFTLLGVKADPLSACMDFGDPNLSQDYTSQLFIVGESSQIDLQPSTEVSIPIKLAAAGTAFTSTSPRIGECSGPDSPSGRGRILPTQAKVQKDFFPYNILQYNACNGVNIAFLDGQGRNGPTIAAQNMILERAEVYADNSVGPFTTFAAYTNPDCTGTLPSEFSVAANTRNLAVFFNSTASASATGFRFKIKSGVNAPQSTYPEFTSDVMPIAQNTTTSLEIFGARRVIADMCYNMLGLFKTVDKTTVSGSAYTPNYADIQGQIFPEKFCSNTMLADGTTHSITPDTSFNFSMRFTQDVFTTTFISLTPTTTASSLAAKYTVQVVGGSYNPTFLRPELPPSLPANTPGCFGPFHVLVENEKGAAVVTDGQISLSFPAGFNHPDVAVFNNNLCNQNYAANFFDDYRKIYYIGVSTTAVSTNTTLSLRSQGQIDHPSNPGSSAFTVSLTTTTNILFK